MYRSPARGSIIARVIATRRAYRTNDLSRDPYTDRESDVQMGFRSQLAVPVVVTSFFRGQKPGRGSIPRGFLP